MTRRSLPQARLPLAALALGVLALGLPATSLAASPPTGEGSATTSGETTTGAATTTSPTTTTPVSPSGEGVGATSTGPGGETQTAAGAPPPTASTEEAAPPKIVGRHSQGASTGTTSKRARTRRAKKPSANEAASEGAPRAKHKAPAPATLTPPLPFSLNSPFGGLPSFFIESFQVPPFLLAIFQAAGTAYGIPWQVLAAINEVETDYGRDLSVSSAGAEGWMQFLPSEWAQYGVDANGDGWEDPYNPADAIFAAARYLRAAGGDTDIKAAVFSYNHSQEYVESVMLRAQLLGATPPELLGAITGLTEARFPIYAPAHFSDGFPTVAPAGRPATSTPAGKTLVGTTIYSQAGAPVIAVQDGEVVQIGDSPTLGRYVTLRDAYGNTYVYAGLGEVASVYPVLEPRVHSAPSPRLARGGKSADERERAPSGPATAGDQPRSPLSEAGTVSALALGAAAALEAPPSAPAPPAAVQVRPAPKPSTRLRSFGEGPNEVYLHPLVPGVQVIAGTVLGHVGAGLPLAQAGAGASSAQQEGPHIVFQIRPAGTGAPLIDPKPILDGWVALEDTSIFRARGENPFLATSPTVGQVLLESQQQLQPQVLHDRGVHLAACAREDVQEGRVDKRVLAMLEYLSVSGLHPTVSGLPCPPRTLAAAAANAPASQTSASITAINGIPVAGNQAPGSIADETVRKLLMLQGPARPRRIASLMSYPGAAATEVSARAARAIQVAYARLPLAGTGGAHTAALSGSGLSPSEWIELIDRLGEIPDPTVSSGHSSAAIPATSTPGDASASAGAQGEADGNH